MVAEDHRRFIEYQTLLILYLQQITPYVDTKDRHVTGLMHGLAAGLSALSDDLQKRWESMVARERRFENHVNDLRTPLSVMQHAIQTLKREVEQQPRCVSTARLKRGHSTEARASRAMRRSTCESRLRWTPTSTWLRRSVPRIAARHPGAARGLRAAVQRRERCA